MKLKRLILLFIPMFIGCEEINDVELNIDHKEYIVVQAELRDEEVFSGVTITKTLPLDQAFDIKKAEVKNAKAFIKINGVQVIPIHYSENGIYKPKYDLKIKAGNVYELIAKADGKSIYSKTLIPSKPQIVNAIYQGTYLIGNIRPKENEAYGAMWVIQGNSSIVSSAEKFYSITTPLSSDLNSFLPVRTQDVAEEYRNNTFRDITYIKIFSFDKSFLEFFKTIDNNNPIENTFTRGGGAVAWNVFGEDVIGLFIGITEGELIKPDSN